MRLDFLGGVENATGWSFLVASEGCRVLIDSGLFEGVPSLEERNRSPFAGGNPEKVNTVILSSAHIHHCGYLPLLIKQGFRGRVFCSSFTRDIARFHLPDFGRTFEEIARREKTTPLYTERDAQAALRYIDSVPWDTPFEISKKLKCELRYGGHFPGASQIILSNSDTQLVYSGTLGRQLDPVMLTPSRIHSADYLILEASLGNVVRSESNPEDDFAQVIQETIARGGNVLIPTFSVGRVRAVLYYLYRLQQTHRLPKVPIYYDSSLSVPANQIFLDHPDEHRLSEEESLGTCQVAQKMASLEESLALVAQAKPMIVLAGCGMLSSERVLNQLEKCAPDPNSTIVFPGYQSKDTLGDRLIKGAKSIRIRGKEVPVRATVRQIQNMSAYADSAEIIEWLQAIKVPPRTTYLVHGSQEALRGMKSKIESILGWKVEIPQMLDSVSLSPPRKKILESTSQNCLYTVAN